MMHKLTSCIMFLPLLHLSLPDLVRTGEGGVTVESSARGPRKSQHRKRLPQSSRFEGFRLGFGVKNSGLRPYLYELASVKFRSSLPPYATDDTPTPYLEGYWHQNYESSLQLSSKVIGIRAMKPPTLQKSCTNRLPLLVLPIRANNDVAICRDLVIRTRMQPYIETT